MMKRSLIGLCIGFIGCSSTMAFSGVGLMGEPLSSLSCNAKLNQWIVKLKTSQSHTSMAQQKAKVASILESNSIPYTSVVKMGGQNFLVSLDTRSIKLAFNNEADVQGYYQNAHQAVLRSSDISHADWNTIRCHLKDHKSKLSTMQAFPDYYANQWYLFSPPSGIRAGNSADTEPTSQTAGGAWHYTLGSQVNIGVLDSGVGCSNERCTPPPDLVDQVLPGVNTADGDNKTNTDDPDGHGTFIASIGDHVAIPYVGEPYEGLRILHQFRVNFGLEIGSTQTLALSLRRWVDDSVIGSEIPVLRNADEPGKQFNFISYTAGASDPFVTGGFYFVLRNDSGTSVMDIEGTVGILIHNTFQKPVNF